MPKPVFTLRAAVRGGLAVVALALAIAGTATPAVGITVESAGFTSSYTASVWVACTKASVPFFGEINSCSTVDAGTAGCIGGLLQASRAFDILMILAIGFAGIGLAVVDLLTLLPVALAKIILAASAAVPVLFGIIAWPIKVSLYTNSCAGGSYKDIPGSHYGAGPWLLLVSWLFTIALIPIAFVLPGPPETGSETMQHLATEMAKPTEGVVVLTPQPAAASYQAPKQQPYNHRGGGDDIDL